MADTSIQWTNKTWNPVTGCQKISPGCKHCYAETIAERFWAKQYPLSDFGTPRQFTDVLCHADRLDQPLRWKKPSMIFVNSMSDLFHEDVPFEFVLATMARMVTADWHTYQILTKRPARALEFCKWMEMGAPYRVEWRKNIWLGVSVENQKYADERIPLLLQVPAAIHWISAEPLLGPINLRGDEPTFFGSYLDWVVVGGESGAGARPMEIEWARSLRDQCQASGVAFFMKQLGGVRDSRGELSDFPEDLRIREFPGGGQ